MKIGFVGLGKMGMNMVTRLIRGGHQIVGFDTDAQKQAEAKKVGADAVGSLGELIKHLEGPRVVWLMVPSGEITSGAITALTELLQPGDTLIDGGNSNFHDSVAHSASLLSKGIHFLDVGTSGGVWGLEKGYCMMIGGSKKAFDAIESIFSTLAPHKSGYLYVGEAGAGHYAKMVHNAIEYGMMQAYGEGFAILEAAQQSSGYEYDLAALGQLWNQGSVIRSWLLELAVLAFDEDPRLQEIVGQVQDSGEGRWTAKEAIDAAVPAPVLTLALQMRFLSRLPNSFSARVCAALRKQFGGHAVLKVSDGEHHGA